VVKRFLPRITPSGVVLDALGNERFGRPHNPDFLLRPGELLEAFATLTVVAFEQGEVTAPRRAVIQRIAAVAGPLRRLPEAVGLDTNLPRAESLTIYEDTELDATQPRADGRQAPAV
jgi:hypothetical protein